MSRPSADPLLVAAQDHPIFDWDAAVARVGGRRHLLMDMARLFLQDLDRQMAEIQQSIHDCDSRRLYRSVHQLKGSLSWFGAASVNDLAARLGGKDRGALPADAQQCFDDLVGAIDRLRQALIARTTP